MNSAVVKRIRHAWRDERGLWYARAIVTAAVAGFGKGVHDVVRDPRDYCEDSSGEGIATVALVIGADRAASWTLQMTAFPLALVYHGIRISFNAKRDKTEKKTA
jgi:hypothetical protein